MVETYPSRPFWQWVALYIVIAVIAYGLLYYFVLARNNGGYGYNQMPANQQQAVQPKISSSPTSSSNNITQQIMVAGNEFSFSPSVLNLKRGQPVQITFKNTGVYPHNFTLNDLNVKTQTIQSGEQTTVTFTPDRTGTFTYLCTVPGHADRGMKGTLTVE